MGGSAILAGLGLALSAVLLTACSGSSSPAAAPTTTLASSSRPGDGPLDAYRAMWADLVSAARTSDYQSTLLSQHASGQLLTLFVQGLARDQLHGIVTRGQPVLHPVVTSLSPADDPTKANVTDCFDDTHWLEYRTAGGLAKNTPGGRRATTAQLVKHAGTWKVTQLVVGKTGTC